MVDFAIGQRFISDTESELGLGVIVEVNDRSVSVLFPASDETRIYAKQSAPLSRVIFAVGDTVHDQAGEQWQVLDVQHVEHLVRYVVKNDQEEKTFMETRLGAVVQLAKPLERLLASHIERKEWYDLRIELLLLSSKIKTSPLRGLIGPRVGIVPHQLYIAHEVGRRMAPRVLLADEVGLGKTIEAGLIIHQQLLTGRSERVLIMVPEALQYQWMMEMRRRFNLQFSLFDLVRTASIKEHDPEANVFSTEQRIICSRDLLLDHADLLEQALEAGFDLLVVDEAHSLMWDEEQGGNAYYDMVEQFTQKTPGVLLLTATPEQLGVSSHFARLRLLDPKRFTALDSFLAEEEQYADTARIAELIMSDIPLSDEERVELQHILGLDTPVEDSPESRQRLINQLLDRHGTGRVLFRNTREALTGFPGRDLRAYYLPKPENWPTQGSFREMMWPEEISADAGWMEHDPRVPWLMQLLKTGLKHKKVLLIARSGAVVSNLDAALRLHAGIRSAVFNEEMSLLERDQAAAYFAEEANGAQILLCSEIGSEGRNFQFASDLILFDLPANPDTLEQRIGRLDRIGQQHRIQVHVPVIDDTPQARLFRWYNEALAVFENIAPAAQTLHELHLADLKPLLMGESSQGELSDQFDTLIQTAIDERYELAAEFERGRDRLLEYSSCRPTVANRIVAAMEENDRSRYLSDLLTRFMSVANIEYDEQYDGSVIVRPSDDMLVDGLDIEEDGMTMIFDRDKALSRDDAAYMTIEHPFVQSVFELIKTQPFGSTTVNMLKSSAIPQGSILVEVWFAVQVVAPKVLNLNAYLPQQLVRVLLSEAGQDLSARIQLGMLDSYVLPMDMNNARQVVKLRRDVISERYKQAENAASTQLEQFQLAAKKRFSDYLDQELNRLSYLKAHNKTIRDDELTALQYQKEQGLKHLDHLHLVPEAIRILVAVKS